VGDRWCRLNSKKTPNETLIAVIFYSNNSGWLSMGERRRNAFAVTLLAKHLILIDCTQQRTIPMNGFHYGGSDSVLLFFWEGARERESNKL
jgi:hypothetical protein